LLQAEKHNLPSIAIPAISTGVFGGNVEKCTMIIVQAIDDYFKGTKKSRIQKVKFTILRFTSFSYTAQQLLSIF